jgi:hypothetical protein
MSSWFTESIHNARRRTEIREQAAVNHWRVNEIRHFLTQLRDDNMGEILAKINATVTVNDAIARVLLMSEADEE